MFEGSARYPRAKRLLRMNAPDITPRDIQERLGQLLPSQWDFIFAPERFSAVAGGFASGKTRALCMKGLVLSKLIPGNVGMILRYRGTDLEKTTMPVFFEVCPTNWIKSFNKKSRTVTLRNSSVISFEHLHDANSTAKTRRLGANLGWFGIDQMEECEQMHWDAMISRLRLPRAPKKFGFGVLNANGKDWNWEKFFAQTQRWPRVNGKSVRLNGKFHQVMRPKADTLGIVINSEENRISNGGFVEDIYFDSLLESYGEDWVERYVYSSFDEFKGKIFKDYDAGIADPETASVHNIDPFTIPRDWECIGGIDVGGDSPWAVIPVYVDYVGNLIVAPGFHNRTGRVSEVASWIKGHMPWNENRTTFVIDWENRLAMVELSDYGIHCQVAQKDVNVGLLRMEGYLHVQKGRRLPDWYEATQPRHQYVKFADRGSPRLFVFKNAGTWRKEHDRAKWDPNKPDAMWKSSIERFDTVEATRYVVMTRPEPSKITLQDREKFIAEAEQKDPLSARAMREMDKRIQDRQYRQKGGAGLREADAEEEFAKPLAGKYDWNAKEEF